jgi:hypothetical protein
MAASTCRRALGHHQVGGLCEPRKAIVCDAPGASTRPATFGYFWWCKSNREEVMVEAEGEKVV